MRLSQNLGTIIFHFPEQQFGGVLTANYGQDEPPRPNVLWCPAYIRDVGIRYTYYTYRIYTICTRDVCKLYIRAFWRRILGVLEACFWCSSKPAKAPFSAHRGQFPRRILINLAIYALSINPTTGAAERNWSTHTFIQSKGRNRLGGHKVEMLIYLFTNLRIGDQINSDKLTFFDDDGVE